MKTLTFVCLFVAIASLSHAQNTSLSFGADVAIPSQFLKSTSGTGFGASFRFEYFLGEHLSAMATAGYTLFDKKVIASAGGSTKITNQFSALPVQVGMKYYPMSHGRTPTGIYLSVETGLTSVFVKATINNQKVDVDPESDFSYAPGLGYRVSKFDLSYRQQYIVSNGENHNFYGNFRLAYSF